MSGTVVVERAEMGITHADFRRIFPRLVADADSAEVDLQSRVEWRDGRRVEVSVSPEMIRKIATLRMPYVNISLRLSGFSESEAEAFMLRFDRAFQKGGG